MWAARGREQRAAVCRKINDHRIRILCTGRRGQGRSARASSSTVAAPRHDTSVLLRVVVGGHRHLLRKR